MTIESIQPLVKWAGGKRSELPFLEPLYPDNIQRFIEPFAGGAAASLASKAPTVVLNDYSVELINFYKTIKDDKKRTPFLSVLAKIDRFRKRISTTISKVNEQEIRQFFTLKEVPWNEWEPQIEQWFIPVDFPELLKKNIEEKIKINVKRKHNKMHLSSESNKKSFSEKLFKEHLETSFQSAFYDALRDVYNLKLPTLNQSWHVAAWWTVRTLCYSGMFRYSKNGDLNVPYGGNSYNARDFNPNIEQMGSSETVLRFEKTFLYQEDFEKFIEHIEFKDGDFLFIDPPYDSAFSTYNHENSFDREEQKRLAKTLEKIKNNVKFMVVVKKTPLMDELYGSYHTCILEKKYASNFRNRHDRNVEHLIITNYL